MKTILVKTPSASYSVYVSSKQKFWGQPLKSLIGKLPVVVITSPKVAKHTFNILKMELKRLEIPFQVLLIPDGESSKNIFTAMKAWQGLVKLKSNRSTRILLLGGGVIGDMGGFAASTFLRGLSFIQIPTTLVGQVDSSIGGKLGIDLPQGKNLVGVFKQPQAVLCHIPFLKTLPEREIRGGLGEVIKYGIICDKALFDRVMKDKEKILNRDEEILFEIVCRSIAIKAQIVSADEKETSGLRMILNLGHTFGHAMERLTSYRKYLHGEAVGLGLIMAAGISHKLGLCSVQTELQIRQAVKSVGLPVQIPHFSKTQWIQALEVDKKSRGGMIHFIGVKTIGTVKILPLAPKRLVEFL